MVIADTGFFLALANRRDRHHPAAVEALASLREPLITTWPVVTETCHLLANRLDVRAEQRFLALLADGDVQLFALEQGDIPHINALIEKYADLPMDLADASLVLLAENLGHGRILSTDQRDFMAYRWKNREPFRNLLLSEERSG
ncbi:type II toxin-antitoxin system VapC family toxin [Endothiovibrio diazotrophicus]